LVCITINLYSFILYILNNFLKKTTTKDFTDGFMRRYYKNSPTDLPTELIRRHLTVAATLTDKFTDGYIRSVFHTLTDNFIDG